LDIDYLIHSGLSERITLAGTPATKLLAETSFVTTAPAPTTEFLSTVTPPSMVAAVAIQTFLFFGMQGLYRVALLYVVDTWKPALQTLRFKGELNLYLRNGSILY
jgi:hypothetical protein